MQTLVIGLVEVEWFVDGRAMHGCMISENRSVVIIELWGCAGVFSVAGGPST